MRKNKKTLSKRIIFTKGKQRKFLLNAISNVNILENELIDYIGVHRKTFSDWKKESYSIPLDIAEKISDFSGEKIPGDVIIKEPFWYTHKGGKTGGRIGGINCFKKYGYCGGDPSYRKKKWKEWWEREGRYKTENIISSPKKIRKPMFSKKLAELVGVVLGDGSINKRQISIILHIEDDKEYGRYVKKLFEDLFGVYVGIYKRKNRNACVYNISSSDLVVFCLTKLELQSGNKIKKQIDIPGWIKKDNRYSIACIRGLVDTDGCIFNHKYKIKSREYSYKKLSFTSYSKPLRNSVYKTLKYNGLNPRMSQERDVRLDSKSDIKKYFKIFGSSNPKHLKSLVK